MPKSWILDEVTFEEYFIDDNSPVLDDGFDLFFNIPGNIISLFQQILKSEVRDGVFYNSSTNLLNSFLQILHAIVSKMRFLQVIVCTWVNGDGDVISGHEELLGKIINNDSAIDLNDLFS